ncbi:MAG: SDR family oxidoreductase [Acidimicrobiales bacterium]|nr:SDR family oxidoreductase [Acidimicrobiales bacterium]RZV47242.1 MAG: SDR family oxidoreductase [Acidimicrobiales bacterium]
MSDTFSIDGKVCVITGAFHGLGEVFARRFAAHGAHVVLGDVRDCTELAAELDGVAARCDVTDDAQVEAMMQTAVDTYGHLDVLINNAGVESWEGELVDLDVDAWRRDMDINVLGVGLGIKHAAPRMTAGASIINIASLFGLMHIPTLSSYGASKAAVIHLTSTAAIELGPRGIRVNAICPTGLTHDSYLGRIEGVDNWLDDWLELNHQHLSELGHSDDCAALAHFLASDEARFINAQAIAVDAGAVAGPSIAMVEAAIGKKVEWAEDEPFFEAPEIE